MSGSPTRAPENSNVPGKLCVTSRAGRWKVASSGRIPPPVNILKKSAALRASIPRSTSGARQPTPERWWSKQSRSEAIAIPTVDTRTWREPSPGPASSRAYLIHAQSSRAARTLANCLLCTDGQAAPTLSRRRIFVKPPTALAANGRCLFLESILALKMGSSFAWELEIICRDS